MLTGKKISLMWLSLVKFKPNLKQQVKQGRKNGAKGPVLYGSRLRPVIWKQNIFCIFNAIILKIVHSYGDHLGMKACNLGIWPLSRDLRYLVFAAIHCHYQLSGKKIWARRYLFFTFGTHIIELDKYPRKRG